MGHRRIGLIIPVPERTRARGVSRFDVRFGLIVAAREAGTSILNLLEPPLGCENGSWYLNFEIEAEKTRPEVRRPISGRMVFGRRTDDRYAPIFRSPPVTVYRQRVALFEFGRVGGT